MKRIILSVFLALMLISIMAVQALAAKPTEMTVPIKQAQFQCRLWNPPGWSYTYQNWETSMDFVYNGNTLKTVISYAPAVTEEEGTLSIYTYNKKCDRWIQHEGTIEYTSPYSGLTITEYWRDYLEFDGDPSANTFEHGIGYQWGYYYGDDPTWYYTNAVWDETMGAWLLGFSIYYWDPTSYTQNYAPTFPDPFIEPVPASNYNPLDL